jgi:hypothetical protein
MVTPWYSPYTRFFVYVSQLFSLSLLLVACGSFPTAGQTGTPATGKTSPPTTVPMPPTQTSYPVAETARRAITTPLELGSHANVVYVYNQGPGSTPHPLAEILRRFDLTTGSRRTFYMCSKLR